MAKQFLGDGETLEITAGATITVFQVLKVGDRIGVAQNAAVSGEKVIVAFKGVWTEQPKLSTDVLADGDLVYWDNANSRFTSTATSNTSAGYSIGAWGNPTSTFTVVLHGGKKA